MKKKLAFVFSGGGSRGALQVGALRALLEAGYQPDLLTGTSIGAANAAFLAVHGFTREGLEKMEQTWRTTADQDLLPANLWWHAMRLLLRRPGGATQQRIREFARSNGLTETLRFADIKGVSLYLVATDLKTGRQVIFGQDLNELVLDGVMASVTLPPWMAPQEKEGRYLMDGAVVSNLPIEAALKQGATEIIALDLNDPSQSDKGNQSLSHLVMRLDRAIETRQVELEMQLAEARGVRVRHILLHSKHPVPIWDFRYAVDLVGEGYTLTQHAIQGWSQSETSPWWKKISSKVPKSGSDQGR